MLTITNTVAMGNAEIIPEKANVTKIWARGDYGQKWGTKLRNLQFLWLHHI
jgi:hypothetical protein